MYLNSHTYYSLRHGVLSMEQLIYQAKQLNVEALALTEINCGTSLFDFYKACKQKQIKPIVGIEFRDKQHQLLYIGLAKNEHGLHELNQVLSESNLQQKSLPVNAPDCPNCFFIYPFTKEPSHLNDQDYIGIHYSQLNKREILNLPSDKLVVWQPVTFFNQTTESYLQEATGKNIDLRKLHQLFRAIDTNELITKLAPHQKTQLDETFVSPNDLRQHFAQHPHIIENTAKIIEQCNFEFDFNTPKNKAHFSTSPFLDHGLLREKTWQGFQKRYPNADLATEERVKKELKVIQELNFTSYFLIAWDVIQFSKNQGFYHVGRGSGANSVVAYCLGITDVDPIELDLYFERFINSSRTTPPDFDLDFSWKERDHIFNYLFKKYGPNHIALLGTISDFKHKSIIRELSKVYGLAKKEIENLIYKPYEMTDQVSIEILKFVQYIQKHQFPNLRSIHAGGVLISEKPITYYSALDLPPKGYPTVQFNMYIAEAIKLDKFDILSQRGIGHINDSVKLIKQNQGIDIDIHQVESFKKNPTINKMLQTGNTIGCFYIESSAMRGLIRKLNCDNYLTLVAASSIIRPGVAKSGMMKAYIERHHDPENVPYPHPIFKEQLSETYGVMVYQEDVLKICHHFAGIDLEDADIIRRAMSGKHRSKAAFQKIIDQYFKNCKERGYSQELTEDIWHQISSFAGYSFAKGHSASYAVESYQSLFLKTYYPLEFMVGVINNFGGYYSTAIYVHEAKRLGANILLPCVNESQHLTSIQNKDIYLGFIHVESLERKLVEQILIERKRNGLFISLENFHERIHIGIEQMILLIRIGAFNFTEKSKKTLLWEAHILHQHQKKTTYQNNSLFKSTNHKYQYPELEDTPIENSLDELELLGFTVSHSYFDLLKTKHREDVYADDLLKHTGQKIRIMGKLTHIKNLSTSKGDRMCFGTFMDDQNTLFDTVHFPNSLGQYPFMGKGIYLIYGKVTAEFEHPSIEVEKMAKLPLLDDPRYADSSRLKPGKSNVDDSSGYYRSY